MNLATLHDRLVVRRLEEGEQKAGVIDAVIALISEGHQHAATADARMEMY
jgi:hypothetical protein